MGLRFRKSINLGGGFKINLSKSGVGYSWGTKGVRFTKKANGGRRSTISVPGTGISWVKDTNKRKSKSVRKSSSGMMKDQAATVRLIDTTCTHCGASLKVNANMDQAVCEHCDTTFLIDRGVTGNQVKKKTWLWVLGWIFIFPLPLTILLLRKKAFNPILKYSILAIAWILYLTIAFSGSKNKERADAEVASSQVVEVTNAEKVGSNESEKIMNVTSPVELNKLQKFFTSISSDMTKEEVDTYINDNGFVAQQYSYDSGCNIGYEGSAVSYRSRDRFGEAIDISYITEANSENIGKINFAEYTFYTKDSSREVVTYKEGVFYYNGESCKDGYEAMQLYLVNNADIDYVRD